MCLSNELYSIPNKSEVEVFKESVGKMMSLQEKMDQSYHGDIFYRDGLIMAVDISLVQTAIRNPVASTVQ